MKPCRWPSTLTAKRPERRISGRLDAFEATATSRLGGSAESETIEVAVSPPFSSPAATVTMLTPPARWRIAALKASAAEPDRPVWAKGAFMPEQLIPRRGERTIADGASTRISRPRPGGKRRTPPRRILSIWGLRKVSERRTSLDDQAREASGGRPRPAPAPG